MKEYPHSIQEWESVEEFTGAAFELEMSEKPVFISRFIIALFAGASSADALGSRPNIFFYWRCEKRKVNKNCRALLFGWQERGRESMCAGWWNFCGSPHWVPRFFSPIAKMQKAFVFILHVFKTCSKAATQFKCFMGSEWTRRANIPFEMEWIILHFNLLAFLQQLESVCAVESRRKNLLQDFHFSHRVSDSCAVMQTSIYPPPSEPD